MIARSLINGGYDIWALMGLPPNTESKFCMQGKRDGKQKYRVRINYRDNSGASKQIDRVAFGIEEAKTLEYNLEQEIKRQPPKKNITVQQLFDEYIEVKKREIRESSVDKSRRILAFHVLPILKDVKLNKLTLPVLQKWKNEISDKNLALSTRRGIFQELRTMLNYAIKMEYISINLLTKLGNFKDSNELKKEMEYYTADEYIKFITTAKTLAEVAEAKGAWTEWNYYVFFAIAFHTGMRKGEIHALQWSDIVDGFVHVRRSITQKLKGSDRETPPKTDVSVRTLQIPVPLEIILEEHKKRYSQIDGFNDSFKVCGGLRPLRDSTLQNRNEKYAGLAGVKNIRIHDFRHSHVSVLVNERINIQEIARRLGHAKIEITWNIYSHLYPREEERAVEILNKIV